MLISLGPRLRGGCSTLAGERQGWKPRLYRFKSHSALPAYVSFGKFLSSFCGSVSLARSRGSPNRLL